MLIGGVCLKALLNPFVLIFLEFNSSDRMVFALNIELPLNLLGLLVMEKWLLNIGDIHVVEIVDILGLKLVHEWISLLSKFQLSHLCLLLLSKAI